MGVQDLDNPAVHSFIMDRVVASTMAIDILELSQAFFPGDFDIRAESAPPKDQQS